MPRVTLKDVGVRSLARCLTGRFIIYHAGITRTARTKLFRKNPQSRANFEHTVSRLQVLKRKVVAAAMLRDLEFILAGMDVQSFKSHNWVSSFAMHLAAAVAAFGLRTANFRPTLIISSINFVRLWISRHNNSASWNCAAELA